VSFKAVTVRPVLSTSWRAPKPTKHTAEEADMNVETIETSAAIETVKEETLELLTLNIEDLDLVGGGVVGSLY
jgi:hypothetical protein